MVLQMRTANLWCALLLSLPVHLLGGARFGCLPRLAQTRQLFSHFRLSSRRWRLDHSANSRPSTRGLSWEGRLPPTAQLAGLSRQKGRGCLSRLQQRALAVVPLLSPLWLTLAADA